VHGVCLVANLLWGRDSWLGCKLCGQRPRRITQEPERHH